MFNFVPSTVPHNIFVIGAGGTGSRLIPLLAQFMRSITRGVAATGWIEKPNIWLIDDDIVEQKNILRQNFIEMDVGKPKAAVLAERYSRAYGVSIIPIMQRVNPANEIVIRSHVVQSMNSIFSTSVDFSALIDTSIVIICVDSVEARRDILNTFIRVPNSKAKPKTFFIDAGNEDNFGQVSFFTPTILCSNEVYDKSSFKLPKLITSSVDVDYVPMDVNYYKDLVDTPSQGSCADLNQTLAINAIMGTTIMGIVQNYFYRKKMSYNSVSISLDGGSFTTFNTLSNYRNKPIDHPGNYTGGNINTTEKDGRVNNLSFTKRCLYISVTDIANIIKIQMEVEEAEAKAELDKEAAKVKRAAKAAELKAARAALPPSGYAAVNSYNGGSPPEQNWEEEEISIEAARATGFFADEVVVSIPYPEVSGDTLFMEDLGRITNANVAAATGIPFLTGEGIGSVVANIAAVAMTPAPMPTVPPALIATPRRRTRVELAAPAMTVPDAW